MKFLQKFEKFINESILLSVNGEEPITFEEFHKINTASEVYPLSGEEFDSIKNLKVGETYYIGGAEYMKYLLNFEHFKDFLNESTIERTRSSNWSKEYLMINYYFYRFGLDKLMGENFRTEQELCVLMDIPKFGLNMHDRNFVSLEKENKLEDEGGDSGLPHTGKTLKEVFYEFSGYTESEFRNKIYPILDLIYKGYNNDYFLDKSKELKKINKSNQLNQLKTELKEIIQNYDFKKVKRLYYISKRVKMTHLI